MIVPKMSRLAMIALGLLVPAISARLARSVAGHGYHALTDSDPPKNPAHPEVRWKEAVMWTVFSGVVAGLARLGTRRWLATTSVPTEGLDFNAEVKDVG
jgi:hypothetical protein